MSFSHQCWNTLLALLVLSHALKPTVARVVDDASFGITRYDFRGVWNSVPGILTVYLRPVCIGRTLFVRGVMGVMTVKMEADSTDRYTAPAALVDHNWGLKLVDRSTNFTTKVKVYKTVDKGERTLTYSQLEAQLQIPNQLDLFVEGSPWRHELYLPECVLSEDYEDHPLKQMPGALFNDKHWLVVMLPRTLPIPAAQYSQLVLSHMRYHQKLGFAGTLLLCDLHQAYDLTQVQEVNQALEQDSIVMWPWHHEHPRDPRQMYWQVPRYQLVTVAAWGHAMRAAYLDVDDFLVLPSGQQVTEQGSCLALQTSQQDMLHQVHWEASLPPGAVVTVSSGQPAASVSAGSGADSSSDAQVAAAAVLRVPRFDALLQGSDCTSAVLCAQKHLHWFEQTGTKLAVSTCPVEQGGIRASRRPVVTPHEVVAMRVYTASPRGGKLAGPNSNPSCAYMLHITNLLGPAKPWGKTVDAEWAVGSGDGVGRVQFQTGQLPKRQTLVECQVQNSGEAVIGPDEAIGVM